MRSNDLCVSINASAKVIDVNWIKVTMALAAVTLEVGSKVSSNRNKTPTTNTKATNGSKMSFVQIDRSKLDARLQTAIGINRTIVIRTKKATIEYKGTTNHRGTDRYSQSSWIPKVVIPSTILHLPQLILTGVLLMESSKSVGMFGKKTVTEIIMPRPAKNNRTR